LITTATLPSVVGAPVNFSVQLAFESVVVPAGPAGPVAPVGPAGPVAPMGIVKLKTAAEEVPELVTLGVLPAVPAVTVPTVIVAAAPGVPCAGNVTGVAPLNETVTAFGVPHTIVCPAVGSMHLLVLEVPKLRELPVTVCP